VDLKHVEENEKLKEENEQLKQKLQASKNSEKY
jgi:regulator of replication initiation timing